ncbi:MAG TPA: LysE family translocator [Candidatus Dormibacteraeota bacterium]|nr:LysE family translocator [Candidatus Dormibacteraeota bacterium]
MPHPTTLLLFALVTFVLTASPGPGVIYVAARTLGQGRRAGFASMFGIESGEVVWIAAAATGLAALLAASADALTVVRYAGAAYLIYLGVQRWRQSEVVEPPRPAPLGRIFAQGFLTQILNPKVAVFVIAFLPQFLDPARPVLPQVAVLGAVYIAIALVVDFSYVMGVGALSTRVLSSWIARRRAGRVAAGTYVALGLVAAVSGDRLSR